MPISQPSWTTFKLVKSYIMNSVEPFLKAEVKIYLFQKYLLQMGLIQSSKHEYEHSKRKGILIIFLKEYAWLC